MSEAKFFIGGTLAATGERLDLAVKNGKIIETSQSLTPGAGAEVVDVTGKLILPGMCDLHVHLSPPAGGKAETLASGASAALAGGITRLLSMPAGKPVVDRLSVVKSLNDANAAVGLVHVHQAAAITLDFDGESLSDFHEIKQAGVQIFCDPGRPIQSPAVLRRALDYARDYGITFALCSETPALTPSGGINEGQISYELGLPGIPVCGEDIAVSRDVRLAESVDSKIHLQCLSSAGSVDSVRRAKERGSQITAEVGIHHLLFTEESIGDYDTTFKVSPPLRLKSDTEALLRGLKDGTIDCLVSAHLPQTAFSKAQDFATASSGMTGLETTLLAAYDRLVACGKLSWSELISVYSDKPRSLLGLEPVAFEEGAVAEFVIFDPKGETEFTAANLKSKGSNTPFLGQTLKGAVVEVVVG